MSLTDPSLALIVLAAFIVGLSKGGLTFAGSLAVPLLAVLYDPLTAAALLLPVYIISDAAGVYLYRHEFSARNLAILVPAGLAGIIIASFSASMVSTPLVILLTGLIGLGFCINAWFIKPRNAAASDAGVAKGLFWGALAGFTSFFSHAGGPPYQAFIQPQRLPKLVYAGTTTMVFAAINLAKIPTYFALGLMQSFNLKLALSLGAVGVLGTFIGRKVAIALPERTYVVVIEVLLLLLSLRLVYDGLRALM